MKLSKKLRADMQKLIKKHGIKSDLVDIKAIWDSSLTENENKTILENFLKTNGIGLKEAMSKKQAEEEKERFEKEQKETEEKQAKIELQQSIEDIKNETSSKIDRYFKTVKEYITTLIKAERIFGLLIEGSAGWGKSFTTQQTLTEEGLKFETDFNFLQTYVTPMEMYKFLYKNRHKIIILDDIGNLFDDAIKVNILQSALWSPTKKRMIFWGSSTTKLEDAPESFEFTGKIIVLTNNLPPSLEALKSRCFHYNLDFSFNDKIKLIYEIGKIHNIPLEVMEFIEQKVSPAFAFNFRTVFKVDELRTNNEKDWQKLAIHQLEMDLEKQIAYELIQNKDYKTTEERARVFTEKTGMSRKTFFNYKKELLETRVKV